MQLVLEKLCSDRVPQLGSVFFVYGCNSPSAAPHPVAETARLYALNAHGSVAFLTQKEKMWLLGLGAVAVGLIVLGAIIGLTLGSVTGEGPASRRLSQRKPEQW